MHVVVYDIEDNRVRARVAGVLEGYGRRVQESVFECRLESGEMERLLERLKAELKRPDNGQIRIYRVCESCVRASSAMGRTKPVDTDPFYIV